MNSFLYEFIGTALLVLLGTGVNANVVLNKTYGQNSGWIVITFGWAIAVFVGVFVSSSESGAHINPAVTLSMACLGKLSWAKAAGYMLSQVAGAIVGSSIMYLGHKQHFDATPDPALKLACFSTSPAIGNKFYNIITEAIGTFLLIFGVLYIVGGDVKLGTLDALPVALLVFGIGLCWGGPTGYAINPARDLGPRIAHFLLPIKAKGSSNWGYAWVPVVGPFIGSLIATSVYHMLHLP
jgi:glycerol uptake facilitator protein